MSSIGLSVFLIIYLGILFLIFASFWKVCEKAGRPGWNGIVPIYNYFVFAEIGKNPAWWGAMLFVPIANIVFAIKIFHGVSVAFGKSEGFTVGMILLPYVFFPILAFGEAKYQYNSENASKNDLLDS